MSRSHWQSEVRRFLSGLAPERGGGWRYGEYVVGRIPPTIEAAVPAAASREVRIGELAELIYRFLYCPGYAISPQTRFLPELRPAESARLRDDILKVGPKYVLSDGWVVVERDRDQVVVNRNGLTVRSPSTLVVPSELDSNSDGREHVSIRIRAVSLGASPGFVTFLRRSRARTQEPPSFRVYIHASPQSRAQIAAGLIHRLDPERDWLEFKVAVDAGGLRRDTIVLYVPRERLTYALDSIRRWAALADLTQPGVPLWVTEVYQGVGIAQVSERDFQISGQGNWPSFGMLRCRAMASALVDHRSRRGRRQTWLRAITELFAAEGFEPLPTPTT